MAEATSMEVDPTKETAVENSQEEVSKTFQERLSEMPAYSMTLSQLQTFYTSLKSQNEVLKNAFDMGEQYASRVATAAKPVVWAATTTALKVAQPVVGEISDPVGALDTCASEVLAKVQEKAPFVKQTPTEIVDHAKASVKEATDYYIEKVQTSRLGQEATKQIDNAVSFSELMVEICFPTDGNNPEDLKEIEKAEEDEEKGLVVRAGNLKDRTIRRGTRTLMTYTPVRTAVDMVQYTQNRVTEMTDKLKQGTNYIATKSHETKDLLEANVPEVKKSIQEKVTESGELLSKHWDHVYHTTMYIPKKAIQVSGEVYISAQEIVFAYTKAHSITEVPHAVAEMAESYYSTLKNGAPNAEELKEQAVAFVYVPAQVVSKYIQSTRIVQWILPQNVGTEVVQVVEEKTGEEMKR